VFRPQQGFRDFRGTFLVMEARILYSMVSGEDAFYPSSGVCHFPLVRQEDAQFEVLFLIPPRPIRVWEDEVSDGSSDDDDFDSHDDDDDWGANPRF
jgi:hypothetical protein